MTEKKYLEVFLRHKGKNLKSVQISDLVRLRSFYKEDAFSSCGDHLYLYFHLYLYLAFSAREIHLEMANALTVPSV